MIAFLRVGEGILYDVGDVLFGSANPVRQLIWKHLHMAVALGHPYILIGYKPV